MIKNLIKNIFYKIYLIGKVQDQVRNYVPEQPKSLAFSKMATIAPDAKMDEATLHNVYHNSSHIIIGKQTQIRGEMEVTRPHSKISIGDFSYLGPGSKIISAEGVTVGNRVLISHDVNIYDNNSHPLDSKERHSDFLFIFENGYQADTNVEAREIVIEDDVWIGFNAIILKGVTIGKGAIIGAGTIVTGDVPSFAVVVGNPMRILKYTT